MFNKIKAITEYYRMFYSLASVFWREPKRMDCLPLQTDNELPFEVRKWGCYLLCALYVLCEEKKRDMCYPLIKLAYYLGKQNGYIESGCFVSNLWGVYEELHYGNLKKDIKWGTKAETCPKGAYELLFYKWNNLGHFVVGNGKGGILYDPMGEASVVMKNGKLSSKRFLWF